MNRRTIFAVISRITGGAVAGLSLAVVVFAGAALLRSQPANAPASGSRFYAAHGTLVYHTDDTYFVISMLHVFGAAAVSMIIGSSLLVIGRRLGRASSTNEPNAA